MNLNNSFCHKAHISVRFSTRALKDLLWCGLDQSPQITSEETSHLNDWLFLPVVAPNLWTWNTLKQSLQKASPLISPGQVTISTLRPGYTQLPAGPSAGHLIPNNQQDSNTAPLIKREDAYRHTKLTDTSSHSTWHSPSHKRVNTQHHPPVCRLLSLPPGSLHNPLGQPHQRRGRQQKQVERSLPSIERRS